MASSSCSMKHLTLDEIKKVIDSFGDFAENTMFTHSLALVISKSGETTFTSCGWKLLDEASFSCPLGKVISNAAKKYTSLCGDDCKYFLFILKEIFSVIYEKIKGKNEICMRREIINEICSLKLILPCMFISIQDISGDCGNNLDPLSFSKDLYSVVLTFMLSRFSKSESKVLSSLICDFIQNICELNSLKFVLDYVISHFDIFCCKILSPISESKVLKGFLVYRKQPPSDLSLENVKFIIVWDLSVKLLLKEVTWEIKDESFIAQMNPMHIYQKLLDYLKSQNIILIFTPSTSDKDLKLLCEKNNIFLFDQLEREEITHMLSCLHLQPLESLNETLESKHVGKLSCIESFSCNKSYFLHLKCTNSVRLLSAHHILLSAPCNTIWKEYYSECLNCIRMIHQWLNPKSNTCFQSRIINEVPVDCDMCSKLKLELENETRRVMHFDSSKLNKGKGNLLPPCSWELKFKNVLGKVLEDLTLSNNIVLHAMHLAIVKSICKQIRIPFISVKDIEITFIGFIKKCKLGDVSFQELATCKEIMINSILDLILQLLKIDSIVFIK